jgi:hypothetical protein
LTDQLRCLVLGRFPVVQTKLQIEDSVASAIDDEYDDEGRGRFENGGFGRRKCQLVVSGQLAVLSRKERNAEPSPILRDLRVLRARLSTATQGGPVPNRNPIPQSVESVKFYPEEFGAVVYFPCGFIPHYKSETLVNFEIKKALNRIVVENVATEEAIDRERLVCVKDVVDSKNELHVVE